MSDEPPAAEAAAPPEKSALELEMEALLGGAGDVLKGTTEAQGEVRRARRKSKELDEQLQQITSSVEAWSALGALVVPCVAMQPTVGCHGPGHHQRRKTPAHRATPNAFRPRTHVRITAPQAGGEAAGGRKTTRMRRCGRLLMPSTSTRAANSTTRSSRWPSGGWIRARPRQRSTR